MELYWLPTPFACFPFTSPPVRRRVPPGSERALLFSYLKAVLLCLKCVVCNVLCISRILLNQLCIAHVHFRVSSAHVALLHISGSLLNNYAAKRHDSEDEMGGARGTYGGEEHCIQDLNLILNWET